MVLSLEGGYDLPAICDCSEECVRALLDGSSSPVSEDELRRRPSQNAIDTLQKTIAIQVSSSRIPSLAFPRQLVTIYHSRFSISTATSLAGAEKVGAYGWSERGRGANMRRKRSDYGDGFSIHE